MNFQKFPISLIGLMLIVIGSGLAIATEFVNPDAIATYSKVSETLISAGLLAFGLDKGLGLR